MLGHVVDIDRHGAWRPLAECGLAELAAARAVAVRDVRAMVRREAPERARAQRTREADLYFALVDELRAARVPTVRLLSEAARRRAAHTAGVVESELRISA